MLGVIGVEQFEDLITDIPSSKRSPKIRLPPATPELNLTRELAAVAERNHHAGVYSCFLGGGAYRHFIPAVVKRIVSRGEYMTSYTPY
ncbi:MAG: glycine dehydrogenase, partial [Chloroflexi bacterium]|nr:glycine dehydrogenase [Chloroflexota bacterium]